MELLTWGPLNRQHIKGVETGLNEFSKQATLAIESHRVWNKSQYSLALLRTHATHAILVKGGVIEQYPAVPPVPGK